MKKKILSIFLLSLLIGSQVSMQVFADTVTDDGNIKTITYTDNLGIQEQRYNRATGIIEFQHNGKWYSFNADKELVGYNKPNKYEAVLFAQTKFNRNLGTNLATDGIFGQSTHSALETYQRTRGLSVDCIIGPITWQYLFDNR